MNKEQNYEADNIQQVSSEIDSFTEDRYRQFYKYFPSNSINVLDLGCNTGRGGTILKTLNLRLEIAGIDVVKERLARLPSNVYSRSYYGSSTAIPCESNYFDVVVAGELIEHLYPEDVKKTLLEVYRVLKSGGRFLLTTPNPNDLKRKLRRESILGGAHVSEHYPGRLKDQLYEIGFNKVIITGSGKVSKYLGEKFPLFIYGSYFVIASKV